MKGEGHFVTYTWRGWGGKGVDALFENKGLGDASAIVTFVSAESKVNGVH